MPMCKIEVTVKGRNNWFTEQEAAWLLSHYDAYQGLPTGKTKGENTERLKFYSDLENAFCKQFLYRDPANNRSWTFTSKQRQLVMSKDDRQKLGRRIRDKFRNYKKHATKATGGGASVRSADASAKEPSASGSPENSNDEADWVGKSRDLGSTPEPSADPHGSMGDEIDAGVSVSLPEVRALGARYGTSELDRQEMKQVLSTLQATKDTSWASIEDGELRKRQESLAITIRSTLKVIERATGAELHAIALWHDGESIRACSSSSDRLSGFDFTTQAETCRSTIVRFAQEQLGPAMSTTIVSASPTVYGDPDNHMRPTLPPATGSWIMERRIIHLFLEYLWVWQGGLLPVPWDCLETDGRRGDFYLVERHRLPSGIQYISDPRAWDEAHIYQWASALRNPDLPEDSIFQFRQPHPGLVQTMTRKVMHPDSQLTYKPELLLYMRRWLMEQAAFPEEWQGLPPVPKIPYKPFTLEQLREIRAIAVDVPALLELVDFIVGYESFGPYQATPNDWHKAVQRCCHLLPDLPQHTSGLEHFVCTLDVNGSQLPRQFFDTSSSKHYKWDLGHTRAWIDHSAFLHRSSSYMGGPYGFKWLVLLILHLHSCGSKINQGLGPVYGDIVPEWTNKDKLAVVATVAQVQENLNQSVVVLMKTLSQRAQATKNLEDTGNGLARWTEEDVTVVIAHQGVDEWARRNLVLTRGEEGSGQYSPPPKGPGQPKKRAREREGGVDNQSGSEEYDAGSKRHTCRRRSGSSDGDVEEPEYDATRHSE
ncbi:hypothetical protein FRC06_004711 [Ceratobasidium sp. 370]|nr:hypothetical protein FRC06_004711 [Ceratobasidium sp. 370]